MPLKLDDGWNNIQLNLADLTKRAYGTNYVETLRVQVHANCRLRRIYFSDRLYSEEELPPEFKLYLPIQVRTPLVMYVAIEHLFASYLSTASFCVNYYTEIIGSRGRGETLVTGRLASYHCEDNLAAHLRLPEIQKKCTRMFLLVF